MDKYRFFALPLIMIMSIILMVGCGSGGGDSGQDASEPSVPSVWVKTYSEHMAKGTDDNGKSVKQTSDGGYIIVGSFEFSGQSDMIIMKTDAMGNLQWGFTFGDSGNDFGRSVQQTKDGGYIVLGEYTMGSNRQMWLIKLDSEGHKQWDRFYGYDTRQEDAAEVQQTSDGGYILVGTTYSTPANAFLVKTDQDGNVQWYKEKGYDDSGESGTSVQQTSDGGFIMTGMTNQFDSSFCDIWLVKVGSDGGTIWHHHYGASGIYDEGNSVRQAMDGGYIIAGNTWTSNKLDIYLLKTDSVGNLKWSRTFGGPERDWSAEVNLTKDGGYVIAGSTSSYGAGGSDGYLIKTDASGNTLWTNTFGGSGQDYFYSVKQTEDGGYIMTGSTESYGGDPPDIYLVKTDPDGSSLP